MNHTEFSDAAAVHASALATALRGGIAIHLRDNVDGATISELAQLFDATRELVRAAVDGLVIDGHATIGDDERVVGVMA